MFAGAALTLALGIRTGMRWDHPSGDMGPGSGWYDLIISFIPARFRTPASAGIVAGVGLELLVGLAAVILLWRPGSSRFFIAAKQARAARR
jgi:hypothetical protein